MSKPTSLKDPDSTRPDFCDDLDTYLRLTATGGPLLAMAVAARLLPISKTRLYYLAKHGGIKTVMIRGQLHVPVIELQRWHKS